MTSGKVGGKRAFQVAPSELERDIEGFVDSTYADISPEVLTLPKGPNFVEYSRFQEAYESLKGATSGFSVVSRSTFLDALQEDGLSLIVLRTILGLAPREWSSLAKGSVGVEVDQNFARNLEHKVKQDKNYFRGALSSARASARRDRVLAMVDVAVQYLAEPRIVKSADTIHRLDKVDTAEGLASLRTSAEIHVPYAMVLYERYLGRPFASHRDAVSELVGELMENPVEKVLADAGITYRKTNRAEKIPGFDQAPDFMIPDEHAPRVIIEAKIASDDGTARDKFTRLVHLAEIRDRLRKEGKPPFQVVACIDGVGFSVRREDMRRLLRAYEGKVFTLATLDQMVPNTNLTSFLPARKASRA